MISGSTAYADMCKAVSVGEAFPQLSDDLYCPVNDVTEHADINRDVKEMKTYLSEDPPNYAKAKEVYTDGVYSSKGGGVMRTLQALAQRT
jgi:hypothetical protein